MSDVVFVRSPSPLFSVENDKTVVLTVFGRPLPKERARAVSNSTGVWVYSPSTTKERAFAQQVKAIMGGLLQQQATYFQASFLQVGLLFCFRRPLTHFQGQDRVSGRLIDDIAPYPTHSDVDNCVKFVLDALNGVLYQDDRRVVRLVVEKVWDPVPSSPGSTTVSISVLDPRT